MSFARTDQSAVAQWWWTVDRWTLLALAMLIGFGSLMVMAASPAVGSKKVSDQEEADIISRALELPATQAAPAPAAPTAEAKLEKVAQGSGLGGD